MNQTETVLHAHISPCICGSQAAIWIDNQPNKAVRCLTCKKWGDVMSTEAEAIEQWNQAMRQPKDYYASLMSPSQLKAAMANG